MPSTGVVALRWQPVAPHRRHAWRQVRQRSWQTRLTRTTEKRRRRTPRRRRGSEKRGCSDTLEESSSADEVDARRKRARFYMESPSLCLTHIQSDTSLHLHITTVRTHGRCSNDTWYHERASVHFTFSRSLQLKSPACVCSGERLRSRRLRWCAPGGKHETRVQLHTTEIAQQNKVTLATDTPTKQETQYRGARTLLCGESTTYNWEILRKH